MFENRPPSDQEKAFQIIRVKPDCRLTATIVSKEFRGVYTHWSGEENIVCYPGLKCKRCDRGENRRWNGYVAIQSETTQQRALLHFTPPVADFLLAWSLRPPFLLGMQITVTRCGPLQNSKLACQRRGVDENVTELELPDLEHQIGKLFKRSPFVVLKIASGE